MRDGRNWLALVRGRGFLIGIVLLVAIIVIFVITLGDAAPGVEFPTTDEGKSATTDSIVTLDSAGLALAGIEVASVGNVAAGGLVVNGLITYDANHVSVVAPRTEGRVVDVRADLGSRVYAGTVLARIESREIGQMRGEVERATASLEVAQNTYEREKRLYEQSISSQKEMLEAQGEYRTALAEYNSAVAQMSGVGAGAGQGSIYGLTSPLAGTIVERNATPGQVVESSTNLFTVADLRYVWITVDVYESDISQIRHGATALVVPLALAGEVFRGRVTYAGGVVDTLSRTLKVRVEVENPGLRLRPGMFAQVRIEAPAKVPSDIGAAILVPQLAVQDLNGRTVVFVPDGEPGRFAVREVSLGPTAGSGLVTITGGLGRGDSVVTKGAFQLKAELMKDSFGDDD